MRREIARAAHYMTRFRCLGGACEDTCCAGWSVGVDEPTHRRLRVLADHDSSLQQLVDEGIELTPGGPSFGRLKLGPSGHCSMLDREGLCTIHARLGSDVLSDVCSTYPRYYNEVDAELELFGTLSCPEVARLCLLPDDPFELERLDDHEAPRKLRNQFRTEQPYYRPYLLLRAGFARLLAAPDHALSEKLFVLLWIASKLSDVVNSRAGAVPEQQLGAALSAMLEPAVVQSLVESYRALAVDGALALSVVQSVLGEPESSDSSGGWRDYCLLAEKLPDATRQRVDTCLSRYAINHLHTTPYMLSRDLSSYVRDLVWRVAALRYLLQRSLAGFEGEAPDVDRRIIDVVYRFARRLEHSSVFEQLAQLLEQQGLSTFAHTVGFLRM